MKIKIEKTLNKKDNLMEIYDEDDKLKIKLRFHSIQSNEYEMEEKIFVYLLYIDYELTDIHHYIVNALHYLRFNVFKEYKNIHNWAYRYRNDIKFEREDDFNELQFLVFANMSNNIDVCSDKEDDFYNTTTFKNDLGCDGDIEFKKCFLVNEDNNEYIKGVDLNDLDNEILNNKKNVKYYERVTHLNCDKYITKDGFYVGEDVKDYIKKSEEYLKDIKEAKENLFCANFYVQWMNSDLIEDNIEVIEIHNFDTSN